MFVLDTNVLSEMMRDRPERAVRRWMDRQPRRTRFTTAVSEAEVRFGIARLPSGRRRDQLEWAVDRTFRELIGGRILPFDSEAARAFAVLAADRSRSGHPIPTADGQVAAIARRHRARIATRNTGDFSDCGVPLVDPWRSS